MVYEQLGVAQETRGICYNGGFPVVVRIRMFGVSGHDRPRCLIGVTFAVAAAETSGPSASERVRRTPMIEGAAAGRA